MTATVSGLRDDDAGLVAQLTLEQKVRLLTGADAWSIHAEATVGLRSMVLSDGPAGVRGKKFDAGDRSSSLPCPVALAATWDERLVRDVAWALGREARAKGVDVLLAPTVNIVRTPLSGRGFECFSEDPVLTTRIAVAYVRGVQQAGVGATVKHFVANDSETDRRNYDARIPERVLRELYLAPFEACVAEADVAVVMAAYNSVNGASMTTNATLLQDLLKDEWGFRGVVVSDWSATRTTEPSALAGLDLVMPGPDGPWGDRLVAAVHAGAVPESAIDDKVLRLLGLARRVGAIGEAADLGSHPMLASGRDRRGASGAETRERVDPALLREVAGRSFVMLRNRGGLLPLAAGTCRRVALIGPNVTGPQTQGGGSVQVLSIVRPGLADSLRAALDFEAEVSVHQGCVTWTTIPTPAEGSLLDPVSGEQGVRLEIRDPTGRLVHDELFPSSVVTWWDGLPQAVHLSGSELVMRARYRAAVDGLHLVGAAGVGTLRVSVDGALLAEAETASPHEVVEAFSRPPELRVPLQLEAGQEVELRIEFRPGIRGGEAGFATMRLGVAPELEEERVLDEAVAAAAEADVAVVVVGSADGTESEGYDRDTLALPGRQDELVRRVVAANPNTVVVINSGMPTVMPWADEAPVLIQAWFPGQAFGEALADCLVGVVEPGGRLPVSLPRAEADSPVLQAHPEAGALAYSEGLLVGYRGYDRNGSTPLFCFGHGLGYTHWSYESLVVATDTIAAGQDVALIVAVRNAGKRSGREIVQVYLEGVDDDPLEPLRVLGAFATLDAEPNQQAVARLTVPARLFARFDVEKGRWVPRPGAYTLRAGRSSRDLRLSARVTVGPVAVIDGDGRGA